MGDDPFAALEGMMGDDFDMGALDTPAVEEDAGADAFGGDDDFAALQAMMGETFDEGAPAADLDDGEGTVGGDDVDPLAEFDMGDMAFGLGDDAGVGDLDIDMDDLMSSFDMGGLDDIAVPDDDPVVRPPLAPHNRTCALVLGTGVSSAAGATGQGFVQTPGVSPRI